ncbi:MAG: hypothetical protein H7Y42_02985 [Chitinophagaceae bacterium]|nr:hypothetical protein [Chitinophagaceae bacterium]
MKRIALFLSAAFTLILAGCFESTDEITLQKDGSGTIVSTTDMSMLITMAKGMGGADAFKDAGGEKATDTTVSLSKLADSVINLTAAEKLLMQKGKLQLTVDLDKEKMLTKMEIPFSNTDQIESIKIASAKVTQFFLGKNMGGPGGLPAELGDKMPSSDPLNEYYVTTYTKNGIEKKLNKEKYATVDSSESMKGIKEMADNGMPMTNTIIINLPKPAKKAEGKNVKLSEDKRKLTVASSSEDFFDDPTSMEFKIEY